MVDAESGEDLGEVLAWDLSRAVAANPLQPSKAEASEATRFASPAPAGTLAPGGWWLTAEGYEWTFEVLDSTPRTVPLARAGAILVQVGGDLHASLDELRAVHLPTGRSWRAVELSLSSSRFEKLPAGSFRIEVLRRWPSAPAEVLAQVAGEVVPGQQTLLELVLGETAAPGLCMVQGYFFPEDPGTPLEVTEVRFHPLRVRSVERVARKRLDSSTELLVRTDEGHGEWLPTPRPAGLYEAELLPQGHRSIFEVPAAESHLVTIALPALIERELLFVDRSTGEPVLVEWIALAFGQRSELSRAQRFQLVGSSRQVQAESARVSLPDGVELTLRVFSEELGLRHESVQIGTETRVPVPLSPVYNFEIVLERSGLEFAVEDDWWTTLSLESTEGGEYIGFRHLARSASGLPRPGLSSRVEVAVTVPGRYQIQGPGLAAQSLELRGDAPIPLEL